MDLVIASNNLHKIKEIKEIVKDRFNLLSLSEAGIVTEIEETGTTFAANALIKARAVVSLTGKPALADDSGLEVYALNCAPGIFSARYSGSYGNDGANIARVLGELKGLSDRRARFRTVIALCYPNGSYILSEGSVEGIILHEPKGSNGFGYDPIFYCNELGKSFAEATDTEKNSYSHRARALRDLVAKL